MILLNLVLFARSFAFDAAVHRTPLFVGLVAKTAIVETEKAGNFQFEVCEFSDAIQFDELSNPERSCRPLTSELHFFSGSDHQAFLSDVYGDYSKRLYYGGIKSLLVGVGYSASTLIPLIILSGATEQVLISVNKLSYQTARALSAAVLIGGSFDLSNAALNNFRPRVLKYKRLYESVSDGGKISTLYADEPEFLDLFARSLRKVSANYLKSKFDKVSAR